MHTGGADRLEIGHFRNFWTSVTLTSTLDWVIQHTVKLFYRIVSYHTVVYHSSTSNCVTNSIEIGKLFVWRMDIRMDIETGFIRWLGGASCSNSTQSQVYTL